MINKFSLIVGIITLILSCDGFTGERNIIRLKDFSRTELKTGGFTLPKDATLHIKATGAASERKKYESSMPMFAYGWIINSDTREKVWMLTVDNSSFSGDERKFDDYLYLSQGSYEVYFSACYFHYQTLFSNIRMNIDHRKRDHLIDFGGSYGKFFSWLEDWFGADIYDEWNYRSKKWGIDIFVDDTTQVSMFNPPKEFKNVLFKAVNLGENENVRQGFSLSKPVSIQVYALGEGLRGQELADYGYILNQKSRTRIWEMNRKNVTEAVGASKNLKFEKVVNLDAGNYVVYYFTDDSHSYLDWNDAPPDDPLNYGITLMLTDNKDSDAVTLFTPKENKNVIVSITKVGNDETFSEGITLKKETRIRIVALGERYSSRRQMADFGWIINSKTREKVWEMDVDKSIHAGGGSKNRMVDEIITLPPGNYIVFYQTDDSHSYKDWNVPPPRNPENWGITIYAADEDFDISSVGKYIEERDKNILAQIIRVKDNANLSETFKLTEPTRIRIYSIGEGFRNEMFDYGLIEDVNSNKVVWEMTYSMTFHAGGARKNRVLNTTILLDKGEYRVRYKSDDSHSYNRWNDNAPEDAQYWGITLYKE